MKFNSSGYLVKEGLKNIWNNRMMSLASVIVLVSCLIITGAAILVSVNVNSLISNIGEDNQIKVFLDYEMSDIDAIKLGAVIKKIDNVEECVYYPKDEAIKEYKEIRPVVQFGDIYRLISPYEKKGLASMMYVNDNKDKAVFYWWKTEQFQNEHLPRVKMAGLDANKMYKVHELNRIDNHPLSFEGKSFSGAYLMNHGLEMPYTHDVDWSKKVNWSSRVLYLTVE